MQGRPVANNPVYPDFLELRSFEQDADQTNKLRLRMELNAGFGVERVTACTRIV